MSNDRFRRNIAKRVDKASRKLEMAMQAVLVEIDARLVNMSPVDTGRFRANWYAGNGNINYTTTENTTKRTNETEIKALKITGQTVFLTNSLPYAYRLEYEGWSKQAPSGMVRITVAEMSQIIREAGLKVRSL
jgi:hypothetical protein